MFLIAMMLATAPVQTQAEMHVQADVDFKRADAALNATYRATMAAMKRNDAESDPTIRGGITYQAALLAAQRAWLAFRDAECRSEGYRYRGGTMQPTEVLGCMTTLTRQRIAQLKALTTEG